MKTLKNYFYLLACSILAFGFTACEKDGPAPGTVHDFYPINFYFTLTGENGEDLLNPDTPGSYAGLRITATYEDQVYEKDLIVDNLVPYGRAYLAQLFGIHTKQLTDGRYALCLGEFDGADTYKDATITLNWGDGTTDVVTFSSKLTWKGHDPRITRSFYLNGTQVAKNISEPVIDIKKSALQGGLEKGWNISPIKFHIFLNDKNYRDLLNMSEGGINLYDIKAIFHGEEHPMNLDPQKAENNQPIFNGLTRYWHTQMNSSAHPIYFGELDGTETFENDTLIIKWNVFEPDTITFTSKIVWKNEKPTFIRQYSLNGKEVDKNTPYPIIRITKDIE